MNTRAVRIGLIEGKIALRHRQRTSEVNMKVTRILRSLVPITSGLVFAALSQISRADSLPEGAVAAVHAICPNAAISAPNGVASALTLGGPIAIPMIVDCDRDQSVQIMIAVETAHGNYTLAFKTKQWGTSERRWDEVSIRDFTLVYSQGCAGSCDLTWQNDYKFKIVGTTLTLVGEERRAQSRADDPMGTVFDDGSIINYQTGTEIVWRTQSKKRTEKVNHFSLLRPVTFEAFNSDEVDELRFHVKRMDGHI